MKPMKLNLMIITFALLYNCGGGEDKAEKSAQAVSTKGGLTKDQIEHGIGPIKPFSLEPLDKGLADTGKQIFDTKCVACHKIDERLVGPPLQGVTDRRSPAFIMNMILNPDEMVKKHPEVKAMLATYYVPMTFQNVTEDEARSILEYLRTLKAEEITQGGMK